MDSRLQDCRYVGQNFEVAVEYYIAGRENALLRLIPVGASQRRDRVWCMQHFQTRGTGGSDQSAAQVTERILSDCCQAMQFQQP